MTSSLWGKYDVIKQFSVLFQVKIRASLLSSLAEIWHRGQFWGTDFDVELKKPIGIPFEREKGNFLQKAKNFAQVLRDKSVAMATP